MTTTHSNGGSTADAAFAESIRWADGVSAAPPTVDPDTLFSATATADGLGSLFGEDAAPPPNTTTTTTTTNGAAGGRVPLPATLEERIETAAMAARLKESQEAYSALATEHREIRLKLQTVTKDAAAKMASLEEAWATTSDLKAELETTADNLATAEVVAAARAETTAGLEAKLEASETVRADLLQKMEAMEVSQKDELDAMAAEHSAAKTATADKHRVLEGQKTSALKGSLQSDYDELLKEAVARERESWEKRHKLLLTDYKELEPRYKAMQDTLEEKLSALEFDTTMIKADKEKLKNDLAAEKAKSKTSRKSLKKSRSESLDTSTKLGDATQSIATLQDAADRLSGQVAEQAARLQGFEDEVAGLTTTARQNNAEITEKRTDIVSLRTEVAQQIRSNTELRDLLDASQSAHSMTKTALSDKQMALSDAEEVTRQLQGNLERREASLKDVEQTLEETMRHHSQQQYELAEARGEAASLAGIAASGAFGLANASTTVGQCVRTLGDDKRILNSLGLLEISTRTAKIVRTPDSELGLELSVDEINQNPGIRVCQVKPDGLAGKTGAINVGDVIVAINGDLVLESSFEEVVQAIADAGGSIVFGLASGDEVDDDESPFWQGVDEAADDGAGDGQAVVVDDAAPDIELKSTAAPEMASIVESAAVAVKSKSDQLSGSIESLQDVASQVTADLKGVHTRVGHLLSKLSVSRRKASAYFTMHHQATAALSETSEKLLVTAEELDAAKMALEAAEKERDGSATLLVEVGAQLAESRTDNTTLGIELATSKELCQVLQDTKRDADAKIAQLETSVETHIDTNSAISAELAATMSKLSDTEAARIDLVRQVDVLDEKCSSLSRLQEAASEGESAMGQELIRLNADLSTSREEGLALTDRLLESQQRVTELAQHFSEAKSSIAGLEQSLDETAALLATTEADRARTEKLLQEEEQERLNLEAGLGEAINALASASEATAKVSVLERQVVRFEQREADRSETIETLRVQERLLSKDVETERGNVEFARNLLNKSGESKAALEIEIDALRTDNANVRDLLGAAMSEAGDAKRGAWASQQQQQNQDHEVQEKLSESEALLESERARLSELESLFTTGLLQQEQLEAQVNTLRERLLASGIGPDANQEGDAAPAEIDTSAAALADLRARAGLFQATDNVIKVFRTFGILTRNVVLRKPAEGGIGIELCHDPAESYKGVIITALRPGGVADQSQQIHVGDYVICINGRFVLESSYEEVIRAISEGPATLSLVLGAAAEMLDDDDDDDTKKGDDLPAKDDARDE